MSKIQIIVQGIRGVGKSTIATLIHRYLETIGFENTVELTDDEVPCSTTLRRRIRSLSASGPNITIIEKNIKK